MAISSYLNGGFITVDEQELSQNPYFKNCRIFDRRPCHNRMGHEYAMDPQEVMEARRQFEQNYFLYQGNGYVTTSTGTSRYGLGTATQYNQFSDQYDANVEKRLKEKEKKDKASKIIRHQFLRNRLKQRELIKK